jgi:internalin A
MEHRIRCCKGFAVPNRGMKANGAWIRRGVVYSGLCLVLLWFAGGCGGQSPESTSTTPAETGAPPVRTAPAQEKSAQISRLELQRRLRAKNPEYQGDGQIEEADGKILYVALGETDIIDISPLSGLDLLGVDLQGLPISDLGPLAGMPLEQLMLERTQVRDLGPLRGMPLQVLWLNHTPVTDLRPLEGMELQQLNLFGTQVRDISAIKTLPLNTLWLRGAPIEDFQPLRGLYLESLDAEDTPLSDLRVLRGMPLQRLNIAGTQVTDLRPLAGLNLTRLIFTPTRITDGLEVIRGMAALQELDVTFREPARLTPEEFWRKYDAGEFSDLID